MKPITLCLAGCVLAAAGVAGWKVAQSKTDTSAAEFQRQLSLARAEGIPTTVAEFVATLPKVPDAQNAAPIYMKITKLKLKPGLDLRELERRVLFESGGSAAKEAVETLDQNAEWVSLAEEAAALPKCQFARDWNLGPALLLPELAKVKNTARLLLIRGSLAARSARPKEALADAGRALHIAHQIDEEPLMISRYVARAAYESAIRSLAMWTFRFPKERVYYSALQDAVRDAPPLDLKAEYRYELVSVLKLIELCDTQAGREQLGLSEEEVPKVGAILSAIQPPAVGRVKIVKAFRELWAALKEPRKDFSRRAREANFKLMQGLLSFATAAKVYDLLSGGGAQEYEPAIFDAQAKVRQVLLRALRAGTPPKTLKTDDILSPLDGKPVRYRWDGKQMVIDAGTPPDSKNHIRLKLPPDPPNVQ